MWVNLQPFPMNIRSPLFFTISSTTMTAWWDLFQQKSFFFCEIIDVKIQKCSGKISINDMRLLQLIHHEFQMNNKLVRKGVLENAEIFNKVATEQYGSRNNHQSGLLFLNKCLIGNICRLLRTWACYGMNDAIGCFGRIYHTRQWSLWCNLGLSITPPTSCFRLFKSPYII